MMEATADEVSDDVLHVDDIHAFRDWAAQHDQETAAKYASADDRMGEDGQERRACSLDKEAKAAREALARHVRILDGKGMPEDIAAAAFWVNRDDDEPASGHTASTSASPESASGGGDGEQKKLERSTSSVVDLIMSRLASLSESEAQIALEAGRQLALAEVKDTKTVTPYGNIKSPFVLYDLEVSISYFTLIKASRRYSSLLELHEYLQANPMLAGTLPEFPPKSYTTWLKGAADADHIADRKKKLTRYFAKLFTIPRVLGSKYLQQHFELHEEEAAKLSFFGKYLGSLEQQLEVVKAREAIALVETKRRLVADAKEKCRAFAEEGDAETELHLDNAMVFGFDDSMRSAPIFGPDGAVWFTRTMMTTWFGNRKSSTLHISSPSDRVLLTLSQFEEESQCFTAFAPTADGSASDKSLFTVTMKQEKTFFQSAEYVIAFEGGKTIVCNSMAMDDYIFKDDSPEKKPVGCISPSISVVEDTRGVQVEAGVSALALLGVVCCIDYWNSPFVLN